MDSSPFESAYKHASILFYKTCCTIGGVHISGLLGRSGLWESIGRKWKPVIFLRWHRIIVNDLLIFDTGYDLDMPSSFPWRQYL